jgi:hypothetical protein
MSGSRVQILGGPGPNWQDFQGALLGQAMHNMQPGQPAEPMGNSIRRLLLGQDIPAPQPAPEPVPDFAPRPMGPRQPGPAEQAYRKSVANHLMTKPLSLEQDRLYQDYIKEAWAARQ